VGQTGKQTAEFTFGKTEEIPFAAEAVALGEQGQRDDLTRAERSGWTGVAFRWVCFAKVIDEDVQLGQKGVYLEHGTYPPHSERLKGYIRARAHTFPVLGKLS